MILSAPFLECGSEFLNYSLQEKPQDLHITEGKIIEKIKRDENFINKIEEIIEKHKNKESFDMNNEEPLVYKDLDLIFALNKTRNKCKRCKKRWKMVFEYNNN